MDFITDGLFDEKDDMTPIGLLEPGGCTHVKKAMNAQLAGLKAVVLIEDANDPMALRDAKIHAAEDAALGYKLTIPYMKVLADDGKKLKDYLEAQRLPVFIKVDLGLTRPDNRVEYELWYSSILDLSKDQFVDLGRY